VVVTSGGSSFLRLMAVWSQSRLLFCCLLASIYFGSWARMLQYFKIGNRTRGVHPGGPANASVCSRATAIVFQAQGPAVVHVVIGVLIPAAHPCGCRCDPEAIPGPRCNTLCCYTLNHPHLVLNQVLIKWLNQILSKSKLNSNRYKSNS
jgi:hypothetical protein